MMEALQAGESWRMCSDMNTDRWLCDNLVQHLPAFGWALNVGANNGITADNTVWLEDRGWSVLCVEPIPSQADHCRRNRKWVCECACGAEDADEVAFAVHGGAPYASDSSLAPGATEAPVGAHLEKVRVRTINRLLGEHSFPRLDYLSVDVEGWEKEVMAGFDLQRWQPSVMVIESWKDDFPVPAGYRRIARHTFDNVYLRDDLAYHPENP